MLDNKNVIYVASFPKSGATWFQFLIYALVHQELKSTRQVRAFYPETPADDEKISHKIKEKELFFIKSHCAYSDTLPYQAHIKAGILIVRDPFNCISSKANHYQLLGVKRMKKKRLLNEFIEQADYDPHTAKNRHGGWNYHTKSWLNTAKNFPVLYVRYEDLIADTSKELSRISNFLQLDVLEEAITNACNLCSFPAIRELEEAEMLGKKAGMFYSKERYEAFKKKENYRFISQGPKRNAFASLGIDLKFKGLTAFKEGLTLAGYSQALKRLKYLKSKFGVENQNK